MVKLIRTQRLWAVTLLELVVVVLIISILATIATGIYTGETRRARIAAAQDLIHQLSVAIARYEVDCGSQPPSGSGTTLPPPVASSRYDGSGYLHLALLYSMSGSANKPASALWHGPYIAFQASEVGMPIDFTGSNNVGMINILDPWQSPVRYVSHEDYGSTGGNFSGGTLLFGSTAPTGANPKLPAPNPFAAQGETYYNTSTYQLISLGPDGQTLDSLNGGTVGNFSFAGAAEDDVTNFGY